MIFLGYSELEKSKIIFDYCNDKGIKKVFILSPKKYYFDFKFKNREFIEYNDIISYVYFYRLLQEIDNNTLVVINECLRTQNRNDLTYNCIRHFLNQTKHQIIFQYLPFIASFDDFFILFDFDTRSKWKREKDITLLKNSSIMICPHNIIFNKIGIITSNKTKMKYEKIKTKLFDNIGLKDPHTIPRNLYLIGGKEKLKYISPYKKYLGRNNRFKLNNLETYNLTNYSGDYTVFEFCHNFINFSDFLLLSKQVEIDVLVTDLKVDRWYFDRYLDWVREVNSTYAKIQ